MISFKLIPFKRSATNLNVGFSHLEGSSKSKWFIRGIFLHLEHFPFGDRSDVDKPKLAQNVQNWESNVRISTDVVHLAKISLSPAWNGLKFIFHPCEVGWFLCGLMCVILGPHLNPREAESTDMKPWQVLLALRTSGLHCSPPVKRSWVWRPPSSLIFFQIAGLKTNASWFERENQTGKKHQVALFCNIAHKYENISCYIEMQTIGKQEAINVDQGY